MRHLGLMAAMLSLSMVKPWKTFTTVAVLSLLSLGALWGEAEGLADPGWSQSHLTSSAHRHHRRKRRFRRHRHTQVTTSEAAHCRGCSHSRRPRLHDYRAVVHAARRVGGNSLFPQSRGKFIPNKCARIMDPKGNLGDIGELIAREITTRYSKQYLDGRSLSRVCPRFGEMSANEQLKAWLWFWMVLANEEATCEPNTYHAYQGWGTTVGWGLFAAEKYQVQRLFRGTRCLGNIENVEVQVSCAVATMSDRQLDNGQGVLSTESYWGPIRMARQKIKPNMSLYTPCFKTKGAAQ